MLVYGNLLRVSQDTSTNQQVFCQLEDTVGHWGAMALRTWHELTGTRAQSEPLPALPTCGNTALGAQEQRTGWPVLLSQPWEVFSF